MQIPKHLSPESKRTYRRIANEFDLGPDAENLLRLVLESWDRAQQARELVTAQGIITEHGKRHPAIDIERNAYGVYLRAFRELGLNILAPGPIGRPSTSV